MVIVRVRACQCPANCLLQVYACGWGRVKACKAGPQKGPQAYQTRRQVWFGLGANVSLLFTEFSLIQSVWVQVWFQIPTVQQSSAQLSRAMAAAAWQLAKHCEHSKWSLKNFIDNFTLGKTCSSQWFSATPYVNQQLNSLGLSDDCTEAGHIIFRDKYQCSKWSVRRFYVDVDSGETIVLMCHWDFAEALIARPIKDLTTVVVLERPQVPMFSAMDDIVAHVRVGPAGVSSSFTVSVKASDSLRYFSDFILHQLRLQRFSEPDLQTYNAKSHTGGLKFHEMGCRTIGHLLFTQCDDEMQASAVVEDTDV